LCDKPFDINVPTMSVHVEDEETEEA